MKSEEVARILDCLTKSPYLVDYINLDKSSATVEMKVGNLNTVITIGTSINNEGAYAKVYFSNGSCSKVELKDETVAEHLYNKCATLRNVVKDYSEVTFLRSCCEEDNTTRTDNYPL